MRRGRIVWQPRPRLGRLSGPSQVAARASVQGVVEPAVAWTALAAAASDGGKGGQPARVDIVCHWVLKVSGELALYARDRTPVERGPRHMPHRIVVKWGNLACECESYGFCKVQPKTCKHIAGNDGTDGAAGWLERQARRGDLGRNAQRPDLSGEQLAFLKATSLDPHRVELRVAAARKKDLSERRAAVDKLVERAPLPIESVDAEAEGALDGLFPGVR